MRLMSIATIAVLIAPVGYFGSTFLVELNDRVDERKVQEAAVAKAARSVLDATGLRFEQVVLGPGATPDMLRFRGRVATAGEGAARSAFGEIDMTCAGVAASPRYATCWTLTELNIDGAPAHETTAVGLVPQTIAATLTDEVGQDEATAAPLASDAPPSTVLSNDATALTDTPVEPMAAETDAGSEELVVGDTTAALADEATSPDAPAPEDVATGDAAAVDAATGAEEIVLAELTTSAAPTHEVQRSLVNARTGPSLDDEVRTQLTAGTSLLLLAEEGSWGRFQILDGAERDLEVWIAFSVLNAL